MQLSLALTSRAVENSPHLLMEEGDDSDEAPTEPNIQRSDSVATNAKELLDDGVISEAEYARCHSLVCSRTSTCSLRMVS